MAESEAEQNYKVFTSLRDKFGGPGTQKSIPDDSHHHQVQKRLERPHSAGKRRPGYEPRTNAPPLMPLVEEGDQIQQELYLVEERLTKLTVTSPKTASPVKGKWKHSLYNKSNHLHGPDFDALETASVTSCSSAYSSKSESGTFSPFGTGSVTELSDVGSCDTFLEYDIHPHKYSHHPTVIKVKDLSDSFEQIGQSSPHAKFGETNNGDEVPDELVQDSTKAWNKVIGDWVFPGISLSSPAQSRMRRPSNEVRIPTPLSTPLGSTDNLLDSGSSCSLLSRASNHDDDKEDEPPHWTVSHKLGKFIRGQSDHRQRPESKLLTRRVSTSSLTEYISNFDQEPSSPTKDSSLPAGESKGETEPKHNKWLEAFSKYKTITSGGQQSITDSGYLQQRTPSRWISAASKNTDNKTGDNNRGSQEYPLRPSSQLETAEEPAYSSIVAQRAERFGGTQRRGLRRAQSFQITRGKSIVTKK